MLFKKKSESLYNLYSDENSERKRCYIYKRWFQKRWFVAICVLVSCVVLSGVTWALAKRISYKTGNEFSNQAFQFNKQEKKGNFSTTLQETSGSGYFPSTIPSTAEFTIAYATANTDVQPYERRELNDIKEKLNSIEKTTLSRLTNLESNFIELQKQTEAMKANVSQLMTKINITNNNIKELSESLQTFNITINKENDEAYHARQIDDEIFSDFKQNVEQVLSGMRATLTLQLQDTTTELTRLVFRTKSNITTVMNEKIRRNSQSLRNQFSHNLSVATNQSKRYCEEEMRREVTRFTAAANASAQTYINQESLERKEAVEHIQDSLSYQRSQVVTLQRRVTSMQSRLNGLDNHLDVYESNITTIALQLQKKADAGWMQAPNGYAYKVIRHTMSWQDARTACGLQGGDLAYIGLRSNSNAQMHSYIYQNIVQPIGGLLPYHSSGFSINVWIGLNDLDREFRWKWLDGKTLLREESHWMNHKPFHEQKDCATLVIREEYWKDSRCSASNANYPLCEKEVD